MITTNLPSLVDLLSDLGNTEIHDTRDGIQLHVAKPLNVVDLDDLVCDALFADPISRTEGTRGWMINMSKRYDLRAAADMRVTGVGITSRYEMDQAA